MAEIRSKKFTGERPLFASSDLTISGCTFENGESPLKECERLDIASSQFKWKYPLWYCRRVKVKDSVFYEGARAGMWYTDDIDISDSVIYAPKSFRRSSNINLNTVKILKADETLWTCDGVKIRNVSAKGDYFGMNCRRVEASDLILDGNYAFDGAEKVIIRNSKLLTKDAFWNCKNVEVYDSYISGEYLGWNSKDLTLVNCTIESHQGMCYIDNLKLVNCILINTDLAFEYSTVEADITSSVDSVFNPSGGTIKAERIGELIIEKDRIDPKRTVIICHDIGAEKDRPEWPEVK